MERTMSAEASATIDWLQGLMGLAVPVYQREYRWTQSACEQFVSDITSIAGEERRSSHFIGSILAAVDADRELTLVDGQQRVTTLVLVLIAIRDLASAAAPDVSRQIDQILVREGSNDPKLRPHERYDKVVRELVSGSSALLGDSTLEANYLAIREMIGSDWQTVYRGLGRLEHVTIELGPEANAQQIFESLNSTGARLTDDELIHNYIHMGRVHAEQVVLERETWAPIEEATLGAVRSFWRDYLIWSSDEQPDLTGEFGVYQAFRRRYPDPRSDLTGEVRADWVRHAALYGVLLDPSREADSAVQEQLRLLRSFEGTPRPLLLGMYAAYREGQIDSRTAVRTLAQVQTMLVRRALVNLDRDLAMVGRLCRELRAGGFPLQGLLRLTPEDPQVRLALAHGSLPHSGYVLARLQRPARELEDLQVEHIYPQNPRSEWSGDGGATTWGHLTTEEQAEYRTVLNTIGNLTLLETPLNQGAGNRAFRDKADKYYSRSQVAGTRELQNLTRWDYPDIKTRTQSLTAEFVKVWPRPSETPMDEDYDLVRVVDLPRQGVRGYPQMFDHAVFDGAVWGDVKTAKDLLVKIADELWKRDPERLRQSPHGWFFREKREPRERQVPLSSGMFLYTGWANQYLLEVAQEFISLFDLDDVAKVRMASPIDSSDS
jgi:hypothetical protein